MEDPGFFAGLFAGIGAWFVFGTATFWIILAIVGSGLVWITEAKNDFFAVVVVVAVAWILLAVNDVSLTANPLQWLKYVGYYLLLGAAWSFLKWISFLFAMRDKLKTLKDAFVTSHRIVVTSDDKIPKQDFDKFAQYLNERGYSGRYSIQKPADVIPSVSDHASDLTRWIVWWPTSAVWTILNDPIRRIANLIVQMFRGIYSKMARAVFKDAV